MGKVFTFMMEVFIPIFMMVVIVIITCATLCAIIALNTQHKSTPLNNPDFKCSSEIEVYGEMVQNTNEYMVIVNRETILPISTRYEITTYYVYKDLSIVCYKQEYTTEVELYASN